MDSISIWILENWCSNMERQKKTIQVAIVQKEDDVERDEMFGLQLSNITPAGA